MGIKNPNVADRSGATNFLGPIGTENTLPTRTAYKKSFTAEATIRPNRLIKFGASGVTVLEAAAASDLVIGISTNAENVVVGEEFDVILAGEATVTAGAPIFAGVLLTSDGQGRAVAAVATNRSAGVALAAASGANVTVDVMVSLCTA